MNRFIQASAQIKNMYILNKPYKHLAFLLFLLSCHSTFMACAQVSGPAAFQQKTEQIIAKVSSACVRISQYDSMGYRRFGSFSGVVVTADGYVLTAAHATVTGGAYLVEFPDGRKFMGTALGRVRAVDAAMIKIDTAFTKFPHCELGWSYDLKVNQPCLSVAYPASLNELKNPVSRLGYIVRTITPEGKMQSTCLMEPGDSGGPVFDFYGRVIALHSKIEGDLDMNLENPIDNYRKYWTVLKEKKDYQNDEYPDPENTGTDPLEKQLSRLPSAIPVTQVEKLFKGKYHQSSVTIKSSLGEVNMLAWGSVVSMKNDEKAVYVVSKSSIVGDHPVITTPGLQNLPAKIVKRDEENDLVLLAAKGLKEGIVLGKNDPDLLRKKKGAFMVSPSYKDSLRVGILGNDSVEVKVWTRPVLGLMCISPDTNTVKILGFSVSIVERYGLAVDDIIDSLNGVAVTSAKQLANYMKGRKAGDAAVYWVTRGDQKVQINSIFQKLPKVMNKHVADNFDGGMSLRNEGFNDVFVHDSRVRPEECGGPVFDLNGRFCGINIARISRTSTLALPPALIYQFLADNVQKPLL